MKTTDSLVYLLRSITDLENDLPNHRDILKEYAPTIRAAAQRLCRIDRNVTTHNQTGGNDVNPD